MRRRLVVAIPFVSAFGLIQWRSASAAAKAEKLWKIGYLGAGAKPADDAVPATLHRALLELGYVEQQSISFIGRWAEARPERLPALAKELVALNVDVIVTLGGSSAQATRWLLVWSTASLGPGETPPD